MYALPAAAAADAALMASASASQVDSAAPSNDAMRHSRDVAGPERHEYTPSPVAPDRAMWALEPTTAHRRQ